MEMRKLVILQEEFMNKVNVFLFAVGLVATGCQEKEEEQVDLDRIVQLIDDQDPAEWNAPSDGAFISGYTSPEELPGVEEDNGESLR